MYIEINLSIDKSGGEANLPKVMTAVKEAVQGKFPEAEVIVRKGFFKTVLLVFFKTSFLLFMFSKFSIHFYSPSNGLKIFSYFS